MKETKNNSALDKIFVLWFLGKSPKGSQTPPFGMFNDNIIKQIIFVDFLEMLVVYGILRVFD